MTIKHSFRRPLISEGVLFAVFYPLSMLFYEIVLYFTVKNTGIPPRFTILFSFSVGLCFSAVTLLIKKSRIQKVFVIILLTVLGILFTLETALYRSFGFFYPLKTVLDMGEAVIGSYSGTVLSTVISILPFAFLYQLPTLVFFILTHSVNLSKGKKRKLYPVASLLTFALIINGATVLGVRSSPDSYYQYGVGYDFNEAVNSFGLATALKLEARHLYSNTNNGITELPRIPSLSAPDNTENGVNFNVSPKLAELFERQDLPEDIKRINNYIQNRIASEKNDKTGIFNGKNLIFVCAEALSPYAVSKDLTPTLYRMKEDGFYFSNYYSPTFGESTSGGEYALLLSQIPKRTGGEKGLSMQLSSKNDLSYSLPSFFRSNGYICNGYHNNSYTYYGRNTTHPALGLNWYGCGGCSTVDGDAEKMDLAPLLSPGWPRSDKELIEATVEGFIKESEEKNKPFFTYYLTVSGHNNYSFSGNSISSKNRSYTEGLDCSNTVKAYLSAQKELDFAMEVLLTTLEQKGILENTVIVIANDHHPYGLSPSWAGNSNVDYLSELYGKKVTNKADIEKGFFCIYTKGITPQEINFPVSSFDVLPTLLNAFGIEYDSRVLCGKDAFASGERLVFFSDGSFITDSTVYENNKRISDNTTREYIDEIKKKLRELTRISLAIRKNDYFSYLSD